MNDPSFVDSLLNVLRELYQALYHSLRFAQSDGGVWAVAVLAGLSFAYGVLHILLPGHQKTVIGAYFVSEKGRYGQGFLAGGLFALFHGLSATVFPLVLHVVLQLTMGQTNQVGGQIAQTVAVVGILGIAGLLFVVKLRDIPELRRKAALVTLRRRLGFDLHDRLETTYEPIPWRKLLPFLFFAALLPCPDTIVFLAALSLGAIVPGLVAVGAMTLGMALTLTVIALTVIAAKRSGRSLQSRPLGWLGTFAIEVAGLVVLVLFALLLLPIAGNTRLG